MAEVKDKLITAEILKIIYDSLKNGTLQLDTTLTNNTKAAPANLVGEMKKQIKDLMNQPTSNFAVDDYGRVCMLVQTDEVL